MSNPPHADLTVQLAEREILPPSVGEPLGAGMTDEWMAVFEALPVVLILVDADRRVLRSNEAGQRLLRAVELSGSLERFGEAIQCSAADLDARGCGHSQACQVCAVGHGIEDVLSGNQPCYRHPTTLTVLRDGKPQVLRFLLTATPLARTEPRRILLCFEEATDFASAHADLMRREAVLGAISLAAQRFLESGDWTAHIGEVLQRLGSGLEVQRVSIVEHQPGEPVGRALVDRFEWCSSGVPTTGSESGGACAWASPVLHRWWGALGGGRIVAGPAPSLPTLEQEFLMARGVASIMLVPIFAKSRWWGFIGLEDLHRARLWTRTELDVLFAAAHTLGAAINRQELELRLLEEQARLRQIFDHAPIGVWQLDMAGKIQYVNQTFLELLGLPDRQGQAGQCFADILDALPAQRCLQLDPATLDRPGVHVSFETVQGRDGALHDLEITKERIVDAAGRVVGLIGLSLDITARKRAEAREAALARLALRLSTARTDEEVAQSATDTALELWSWDACFLMRYDRGTGNTIPLIHVDTIDGRRQSAPQTFGDPLPTSLIRRVLEEGGQLILREQAGEVGPITRRFGDLERPSMSMMYVPVRHEGLAIGCLSVQSYEAHRYDKGDLAVLQALADHCGGALMRVRAESLLEAERLRFQHLFHHSPVAIWLEDFSLVEEWMEELRSQGVTDLRAYLQRDPGQLARVFQLVRVLDVNQAAVEQNGARDKAHLIANLPRLFTEQTYVDAIHEFDALWQGRVSVEFESTSVRLDGRPLILLIRIEVPRRGGVPDFSQLVVTGTNITERRQAESQLRQAQKMEAIGQLAGGVAHDFNNILTAMTIQIELLAEDFRFNEQALAGIQELEKNAARAADLTRQLLTFSRRQVPRKQVLSLDDVVASVARMLGRTLGEHITMQLVRAPAAPWIEADRGMLEQVVMNLAINARDAMPNGGQLTVSTETRDITADEVVGVGGARPGPHVVLRVSDTGCGMDAETRSHIFEPFFTTKATGKGTGLGLATVYGIVQQHQGWIQVESEVGLGTVFRVYLPAASPGAHQNSASQAVTTRAQPQGQGTILVVEDEASVRLMVRSALVRCGYTILEAKHGAEALEVWRQHEQEIDLLFTDMVMPGGIGGLQLAKRLRTARPDLRVIFTSGYSRELEEAGERMADADDYLPKPFSIDVLTRVVQRVLGRGRSGGG